MSTDPSFTPAQLAEIGAKNLSRVIAIDSQSDERSDTVPSSEGQRRLGANLADFFSGLGFATESDENANLIVTIPASADRQGAPKLAFMIHMDTALGTAAVDELIEVPAWDGAVIRYPNNDRLEVSVERYPETEAWVGGDVLHGPGESPIGLDDKLGLAEMMTLAEVLAKDTALPHPEITLICRPDEEIGRMSVVEGLADELKRRNVKYGYTIDGIGPFEVQVENFNASRGTVRLGGKPLTSPAGHELLHLKLEGCKSHGATAKSEGYLNATVIVARALGRVPGVTCVAFESDVASEVNADLQLIGPPESLDAVLSELKSLTEPHAWRGARVQRLDAPAAPGSANDAAHRALMLVTAFLHSDGPTPLLSENSEGRQGYSNPYSISVAGEHATLEFRLRDFDPALLNARERHIRDLSADMEGAEVEIQPQYVNMGPSLAPFPELARWAEEAGHAVGAETKRLPIRGGTGVDPFLARKIPVANLGTGYFAPESEKEFTSKQMIAAHARWLVHLVQRVG